MTFLLIIFSMFSFQTLSCAYKEKINKLQTYLWPNAIVPYTIENNISDGYRHLIEEALYKIMDKTCIIFLNRTAEENYVTFTGDVTTFEKNHPDLGYLYKGQQYAPYDNSKGFDRGYFFHSAFHVLGVADEQNRFDRNEHLRMMFENVKLNRTYKYYRNLGMDEPLMTVCNDTMMPEQMINCTTNFVQYTYGLKYNPTSVTHVNAFEYRKNNNVKTYEAIDSEIKTEHAQNPNEQDYETLRKAYGCDGKTPGVCGGRLLDQLVTGVVDGTSSQFCTNFISPTSTGKKFQFIVDISMANDDCSKNFMELIDEDGTTKYCKSNFSTEESKTIQKEFKPHQIYTYSDTVGVGFKIKWDVMCEFLRLLQTCKSLSDSLSNL